MNQTVSIGKRLREERERLGLNQPLFGEIGGVTKKTQMLYEGGDRFPDAQYLAAVAAAGVDVLYILTGQRSGYAVARPPSALMVAEPSPVYAKNKEEEALLDNYRNSPPEGQSAIRTTSAALAKPKSAKDKRGKAA